MRFLVVLVLLLSSIYSFSIEFEKVRIITLENVNLQLTSSEVDYPYTNKEYVLGDQDLSIPIPTYTNSEKTTKRKIIAITLAVTLGVFGVHRLYLGTSTKVPIIYTLTLGGGFGVLVVSDIIAILATKNLEAFSPNEKVFMWAE